MPTARFKSPDVDTTPASPLYLQVFTNLRDGIFRGDYPPQTMLPGEITLGEQFGVSRITIRRALDELATRGLIEREQGRGTRVAAMPSSSPVIADIDGLLRRNVVVGKETTSKLLEFGYVPAPRDVVSALGLRDKARVQMAVRVRTRNGIAFAHVTSWIPESVGRRYKAHDLEQMPVVTLLEKCGIAIGHIEQTISAVAATRAVARALSVDPGAPLLKVERTVFSVDGAAVEKSHAFYPADRHQYRITLRRPAAESATTRSRNTSRSEKTKC